MTIKINSFNREDRIRTCDPLVPNQVLYQAELLPDKSRYYRNRLNKYTTSIGKMLDVIQITSINLGI